MILAIPFACTRENTRRPAESGRTSIGHRGNRGGQFYEPRALASLPDGTFFVGDKTGRIQKFTPNGTFLKSWVMPDTSPDKGKPSGACVDARGRLLVADTHFSRIIVFDAEGAELLRFGRRGFGPGEFMLPTDVAVDADGFIYVCEYGGNDRVSKLDSEGDFVLDFGGLDDGDAALQRPSALAIDVNGNVLVADTSNHRICRFSPDGVLLATIGGLGEKASNLRHPRDVAVDSDNRITVADYGNDRIVIFNPNGSYRGSWGSSGRLQGELHRPINLAFSRNFLLVADCMNHRVVMSSLAAEGVEGRLALADGEKHK